ncbi:MAG: hypothetical protein S4CHLAM7_00260 [Chlamydiae bacterium]|nr:hypothetical protein [Chlamydiota bacterium]
MEKQMRQFARQVSSQEAIAVEAEEGNQYITAMIEKEMKAKSKTLEERTGKDEAALNKAGLFGIEENDPLPLADAELNPELDIKSLLILKAHLQESDSTKEILEKVLEVYSDYSLADDALEYLEKISEDTQIEKIRETRSEFNELFGREIKAGKNITQEARAFSAQGLGSPTALRDLYREITGNPRTPNQLFEELAKLFNFEDLKKAIKFLLNSLSRDLKAKGSSIPKALLYRLMTETTSLQAIFAVYLFFKGRMNLLYRGFDQNDLYFPKELNFELMAKLFMRFIEERHPSAVKVLKLSPEMGVDEDIVAQVLVYTQFRDAVRGVAPKLYKSIKHRQEILNAFLDVLEELDEALEEEED